MIMKKSIFSILIVCGFMVNIPLSAIILHSSTHYFQLPVIDGNCVIPNQKIAAMIESAERSFGGEAVTHYAYLIRRLANDNSRCHCTVFFVKGNNHQVLASRINEYASSCELDAGVIQGAIINLAHQKL